VRIASYTEARLIIAEIEGGASAVNIINALHTANGLPLFASVDPAAIQAQVQEERQRDFFLEGRQLGDPRRKSNQLSLRPPEHRTSTRPRVGSTSRPPVSRYPTSSGTPTRH